MCSGTYRSGETFLGRTISYCPVSVLLNIQCRLIDNSIKLTLNIFAYLPPYFLNPKTCRQFCVCPLASVKTLCPNRVNSILYEEKTVHRIVY